MHAHVVPQYHLFEQRPEVAEVQLVVVPPMCNTLVLCYTRSRADCTLLTLVQKLLHFFHTAVPTVINRADHRDHAASASLTVRPNL